MNRASMLAAAGPQMTRGAARRVRASARKVARTSRRGAAGSGH